MIPLVLIIFASLVISGMILRVKSISSGRKGPGILQPLKNLRVLFSKSIIYSKTSGPVSRIAPPVILASVIIAALMIPAAGMPSLISFKGDFILFAYLMALSRFMMIISAMDQGSSFEGMGASREALFGMLLEPALFIIIAALVVYTGQFSMSNIFIFSGTGNINIIFGLIISYVLGNITLVENSRLPVDDPKTHLELTMIHEVMVLDTSGFNLALIQLTSLLKFAIFGSLISSVIIPQYLPLTIRIVLYLLVQAGFAVTIGITESFRTRFRMSRNQQFILTISVISVILYVVILFSKNIL